MKLKSWELGKEKDVSVFAAEDPEPIRFGAVPLAHRPEEGHSRDAGSLA